MESSRTSAALKFILFSILGIFIFFVQITVGEYHGIPLDIFTSWLQTSLGKVAAYLALAVVVAGAVKPFITKTWNKSAIDIIFTLFKIFGVVASFMVVFNFGPEPVLNPDNGPYLFGSLVQPVVYMIVFGAPLLCLMVNYGLVDFVGIFVRPLTRTLWKTPGRSAVDAVSSFVGSTSMGLLFTDQMYRNNKYNAKEASIIATGFTTVAVSFMIIVANVLEISDHWLLFFLVTMVVTFACTAVTCRIYPLSKKPETYYDENLPKGLDESFEGNIFKCAYDEAIEVASKSGSLGKNMLSSLKGGVYLLLDFVPLLMGIGLTALILQMYTPIFDYLGYIFYPLTKVLGVPDALPAAQGALAGLAEMFLPVIMCAGCDIATKFFIGIISISEIIMFSCTIPMALATNIPITLKDMVIVWFERTVISIILAAIAMHIFF